MNYIMFFLLCKGKKVLFFFPRTKRMRNIKSYCKQHLLLITASSLET